MVELPFSLRVETSWGSVCSSSQPGLPASANHLGDRFALHVTRETAGIFAIDVEHASQVITPELMRLLSGEEVSHRAALISWTRLEVIAKLKNLPILHALGILRMRDWAPLESGVSTQHHVLGNNILCVGRMVH